jgi:O-antigen ligase
LLGQGLGGFRDAFRAHIPPALTGEEWDMAHSSYLENAYELGLPAAVLFYVAIAVVLVRLWRGTGVRRTNRGLPAFAFAVGVVGALHATVDFSLQIPAVAALFAFCLGLGWAQSFPRRDRRASRRR